MEKWKHRERVIAREPRRMDVGEGEWTFDHAGADITRKLFVGTMEIVHPRHNATTMEKPCEGEMA